MNNAIAPCSNIICADRFTLVINILIAIFLLVAFSSTSYASSSNTELYDANAAYRSGEFQKAAKLYRSAQAKGITNPALYYNLANAEFKSENYADAIANYRLALQLNPSNPDIKANLVKARKKILSPITSLPSSKFSLLRENFGIRQLQLGFMFSYLLLWIIFITPLQLKHISWLLPIPAVVCSLSAFSLFFLAENADGGYRLRVPLISQETRPVVVLNEAVAHSGDGDNFAAVFRVKAGDEYLSMTQRNSWVQIKTTSGRIGWLPQDLVEIL